METATTRFYDLLNVEAFEEAHVAIVGVGAIGRPVALMLAQMGIGSLTLIDPDTVEVVNIGPQGYTLPDIGRTKVDAAKDAASTLSNNLEIYIRPTPFLDSFLTASHDAVVMAVDSMEVRREIYESCRERDLPFIDTRMGAETCRILAIDANEQDYERWLQSWFPDDDPGAVRQPCTRRSTAYCALVAAGLCVSQLTRLWRRSTLSMERDITVDLFNSSLYLEGEQVAAPN